MDQETNTEEKFDDKKYSGTLNLRMGAELHAAIAHLAKRRGISINEYILSAITRSLI